MTPEILIPEELLYDISHEDVWEYGVNGIYSEEHFNGFKESLMLPPGSNTLHLTDHRLNLLWKPNVDQFKSLTIWPNIRYLKITVPINDDCLDFILSSPTFAKLEKLFINTSSIKDSNLISRYTAWQESHVSSEALAKEESPNPRTFSL